jgi:hypothetical protein
MTINHHLATFRLQQDSLRMQYGVLCIRVVVSFPYMSTRAAARGRRSSSPVLRIGATQVCRHASCLCRVLWIAEEVFTRRCVHNFYLWATDNPHVIHQSSFRQRFSVNFWAVIVNDCVIGPYVIQDCLGGAFLEEMLSLLLENLDIPVGESTWLQLDGDPHHFARRVRNWLDRNFSDR